MRIYIYNKAVRTSFDLYHTANRIEKDSSSQIPMIWVYKNVNSITFFWKFCLLSEYDSTLLTFAW